MNINIVSITHPDPWVDLPCAYVAEAVVALDACGKASLKSWLDPCGPRDATIVGRGTEISAPTFRQRAPMWDEETGWHDALDLALDTREIRLLEKG